MVCSLKERKKKIFQGCSEIQNESGVGASLSVSYFDPQLKVRMSFLLSLLCHVFTSYHPKEMCLQQGSPTSGPRTSTSCQISGSKSA